MKMYEAVVDIFFSTGEDKDAAVITMTTAGTDCLNARENLINAIRCGEVKLPEGSKDFYVWDIFEDDLLKAS